MWNLTKEAWEKFLIGHSLAIPETDEEWSEIINEAKEEGENLPVPVLAMKISG